jgi:hypothetical protein
MKKSEALELLIVVFVFFSLVVTWTRNITIQNDQIPSIINGMVASISMIIGFSGAIMIFTLSRQWEKLKLGMVRPIVYLLLVGFPLALLWTMYSYFLDGNFDYALKMSMSDLAIASAILVDFLLYYTRETIIHMRRQTQRDLQRQIE